MVVEVSDRDSLEDWLHEQRNRIAIAIAARAALRILPLAIRHARPKEKQRSSVFVLPMLRALSMSRVASAWPTRGAEIANASTDATNIVNAAHAYAVSSKASDAYIAALNSTAAAAYTVYAVSAAKAAADAAHYSALAIQDGGWHAVVEDVTILMQGKTSAALARLPLWSNGTPDSILVDWRDIKQDLLVLDENWQVWTTWYDDILYGIESTKSRPLIEDLEVRRAQIPDKDWEFGPVHVNALITEMETEYRAKAPAQRPAIIEVKISADGRLHRMPSRPPVARDAPQEQRLRSAWSAHSDHLRALEALDPGRNSPGLGRALSDYRKALGLAYEALDVIALGVHGTRIESHAARADERLMEDAAGELVSLAASHSLFIQQFATWREYLADAAGEPTDEVVAAAASVVHSVSAFAELIAEDVTEPLVALADVARPALAADPEDRPTAVVKGELIKSVGNVLSGLFAPLLAFARDHGAAARQGSLDGTRDFSKQATQALLFAGTTNVAILIAGLPAEFGWLATVLAFLKMKFKP